MSVSSTQISIPAFAGHGNRVMPWGAEELVQFGALRCVYDWTEDGAMLVHLPGKRAATVEQLVNRGCVIALPVHPRGKARSAST